MKRRTTRFLCGIALMTMLPLVGGTSNTHAASVTLDFQSVATGSDLLNNPLVTSLGTITVVVPSGGSASLGPRPDDPGLRYSHGTATTPLLLTFDFDVQSINFDYHGAGVGVFTAEARDVGNTLVDSFFDPNTSCGGVRCFDGNVTLNGLGIRSFGFIDNPSAQANAMVDNIVITAVPAPSAMLLMGSALVGLVGWRWWGSKKI